MGKYLIVFAEARSFFYCTIKRFIEMADFQNGLFGCFSNCTLCIVSYLVPCYTHGKTAEAVGDDCLTCGLVVMVPLANIFFLAQTRGKVRTQKGIDGSFLGDIAASCCCFLCTLVQSANEVNVSLGMGGDVQEIERH